MGALLEMARRAATPKQTASAPGDDWGYELADLLEMDALMNRLCDALDLAGEERAARLKARRCMAPVRIPGELAALRKVVPATEARLGVPF